MQSIHGTETKQMLEAYDFSNFETLMDIGVEMEACLWRS